MPRVGMRFNVKKVARAYHGEHWNESKNTENGNRRKYVHYHNGHRKNPAAGKKQKKAKRR